MSSNQARFVKSDGQLRKTGGRSGNNRGFSGGGRGGKGGGGASFHEVSSSPNQPPLSSNRSFKKSSNGQGAQSRINPASSSSEASVATAAPRTVQNGAHGQPPSLALPSGPRPDTPISTTSRPLPKAPSSQSSIGISDSTMLITPVKGEETKPFALQFGTISPGIVNGLQIPARTSSAPPNLDEQLRDQAHHDSFRAVPTQPIPPGPKQKSEPARKDVVGIEQSTSELHPPVQQPPISMQFGTPVLQQMPMTLPIGNASQVPQQMFAHNLQSHPMQHQAMIHQGQGLGFGPQHGLQLGPQFGNLGIAITAPQFSQQQQQPANFGGPRKTTVKITHPETHEELRLDKRTNSHVNGSSSGQRLPRNAGPQSHTITSFTSSHYFPQMQPNSYNPSPIYFPTSTSLTTGSQPPRISYPAGQSGQAISFMNPSLLNPMPGSKSLPPFHSPSEMIKSEPPLVTAPPALPQGSVKPTAAPVGPKVGGPSVTISMPNNKAEETRFLKPAGEATFIDQCQQRNNASLTESSPQQSETLTQLSDITRGGRSVAAASVVSTKITYPGTSSAPAIPSVNSGSALLAIDSKKIEPIGRSDSLKDNQKKSSIKDLKPSQQQGQTDESATNLSSLKIYKDSSSEPVSSTQLVEGTQKIRESSGENTSTATTDLPSSCPEHSARTEARSSKSIKSKFIPADSGSTGAVKAEDAPEHFPKSCTVRGPKVSSSADFELDENISENIDSASQKTDNVTLEVECRKKMSEESEHGKAFEVSTDNSNAKVDPVPTITRSSEDGKPDVLVKEEESRTAAQRTLNMVERTAPTSLEHKYAANNEKDAPSFPHTVKDEMKITCVEDVGSFEAPISERTTISEASIVEIPEDVRTSSVASGLKDKIPSESAKVKPITGKKKKRREIFSKADAAGRSDLYNAYKGPEEKPQLAYTSESVDSSSIVDREKQEADNHDKDEVKIEEDGQRKAEVDDWEDAADISTPKLENGKQVNETNKHSDNDECEATSTKKYTRDFLLTFLEHCTDLPVSFEIGSDIADVLMSASLSNLHVVDRGAYPSPGRITERSQGVSRNDDRWSKAPGPFPLRSDGHNICPVPGVTHGVLRNPRGQASNQFPIFPGPMQSVTPQGGSLRYNSDSDQWRSQNSSRGLMPSPQTPLQVMHKAERKYEIGKVSDEEQAKQRQLKGILNKLTPQNFEKLFLQVKEVNIDNTVTLSGVISQIFDKALMEPTFCEMYANFCFHLSGALPDFTENDEKITFRRLLLNKCQEEFERGEREQAEADRVEEEGEIKQSQQEREEKRIKARRRMLGNIRLIGELYKKKMLTERIMHECIQKLLRQHEKLDVEDLESLCKLMTTIGDQIDHAKAKEHMDAYFEAMIKLSTNQELPSRVRFMLRDVIDLRKNRWQQRRKVEGPKKIEEVHRDAAQERQSQTSRLTRGPSMNSSSRRGPPIDYGPRASSILPSPGSQTGGLRGLPSQARGYGMQDVRSEDRHPLENRTLLLPLTQRPDDSSITLGPQGGLARGMSFRGQTSMSSSLGETLLSVGDNRRMTSGSNVYNTPDRVPYSSREDAALRTLDRSCAPPNTPAGRTHESLGCTLIAASDSKPLNEEALREKSISAIREFYSAKDEEEVALCIKELNSPSFYPSMVSLWVTDSFERKDIERDLLAKLLVDLCKSQDSLLSENQLSQGFGSVLSSLEDAVNDAPRAAEFLGRIFVKVILENVVSLRDIGKLIHEGGEEPGRLLEIGLASEVLGSILESIKLEKGEFTMKEILVNSNLRLEDFRPPHSKSKKLDAFL
ncbi:LOW QUALITY PROTEIN: eukaryotic translation initiation factor 4G-like [Asparagus officinalis]|uniref:LOW QUALITY PROTEIN: eukaryotic translation initiation factor 4G-like n=1 Tax=Asparagus officinalis TaxID=4686 RepID=UPI00098E5ACE|nr:LOW QUALITY PROTEIN: eukaryotic translation initiation factor 4G-like [Asparagus officinalis]